MNHSSFCIGSMSRDDFALAVDWAAAEGWNPGLDDPEVFYRTDPGGFLMGRIDDRPVSVISAVRYGDSFGFIGFYIVDPEFRGQGFGLKTWDAAMALLGDRRIGLDGVVDQQDNYRKSGFTLAHRNIRQEGRIAHKASNAHFIDPSELSVGMIMNFDSMFFPVSRPSFIEPWIQLSRGSALARVEDGRILSLGVIRECRSGWKIGPLFAETPDDAEDLFRALQTRARLGEPFYLDTPEPNGDAVDLASRHQMTPVFETARMYRGAAPEIDLRKVYGITTFELG